MGELIDKIIEQIKKDVVNEQAILIVDEKYNVIYCNSIYEKISGYTLEELKGKKIDTIGVGDKLNKYFKQKYREKIKDGNCLVIFKNYKKNGEVFYILTKIKKIEIDKEFYYYGLVFSIDDIVNDLSLFLFELDLGSVFFSSINERIVVAIKDDDKFDILFYSDLIKGKINNGIIEKLKKFAYSNDNKIILDIENKHFKVIKFTFDYKNVINSEYIIYKFIDITNEYKLIEENEKKIKMKQEFVSSIIHDINTPLTAINSFVKFIKASMKESLEEFCLQTTNDEYKNLVNYLNNIESNIDYLTNLMNDLLDLNKFELNNKIKIKKSYFNVDELDSLFNLYKFRALKKKISFEVNVSDKLKNKLVYSDIVRIKQILSNLISNAVKFTQQGYVRINLDCFDNNLIICVEDTGIGIDKDKLHKIFDLYEREYETFDGHGIGMFIVKNIVQSLRGNIKIESEKNKGTQIYIEIPVKCKNKKQENEKIEECDKKNFKILIVEDDEIMQSIYKKILNEKGYTDIKFIDTCKELQKEIEKDYDLFIIDNILSDCKTFDMIGGLNIYNKKILFITGSDEYVENNELNSKNIIYYLKKPFSYNKLISLVDEFLCS